ncbi:MAG TPA: hypothetical protein VG166_10795 [Caulobacteraceae bacterium]|nr:hypothetical protein [Caulobacteraceae bacterium]
MSARLSTRYGDFTHACGRLKLDPKHPAASRVEVSVPTAVGPRPRTGCRRAYRPRRHQAGGVAGEVQGRGGPQYAILEFYEIGFDLTGKIKRSDFGMNRYTATIGDEVYLIISAPFERKGD